MKIVRLEFMKPEWKKYIDTHQKFLDSELATRGKSEILALPWKSYPPVVARIVEKPVSLPRLQVSFGDPGAFYRFSGTKSDARPWSECDVIKEIRDAVAEKTGENPNFCLVNVYRDGNDYIGYHSDDTSNLVPGTSIISVSLGATRDFYIQKKSRDAGKRFTFKYPAGHNTCIIMRPGCQNMFKHSVPKRTREKKTRINLTFRTVNV